MAYVASQGEIFNTRLTKLGFKLESVPGVAETLAAANYNVLAEAIKFTPTVDKNERKYGVGDPNRFVSIMGKQSASVDFTMHLQGSGLAATAPVSFTMLQASGWRVATSTFCVMAVKELTQQTATIEVMEIEDTSVNPRAIKWLVRGCQAEKMTLHWDEAGQLVAIDFSFKGALIGRTDIAAGSITAETLAQDATLPRSTLQTSSKFNGYTFPYSQSMTLDCANKLTLVETTGDSSGYSHSVITDHDPMITIKSLTQLEATYAAYTGMLAGRVAALEVIFGPTGIAGERFTLKAPNARLVGIAPEDHNGLASASFTYECTRETGTAGYTGYEIVKLVHGTPTGIYG